MTGHGVVHINYNAVRVPQFEHTVVYTWFDLLGLLGGICSITFGGSIITILEIIYFYTGRFGMEIIAKIKGKPDVNEENEEKERRRIMVGPYAPYYRQRPINRW